MECNNDNNRNIELILIGVIGGGFAVYLFMQLLGQINILNTNLKTYNSLPQYQSYPPYQTHTPIVIESPVKPFPPSKKTLYSVQLDEDGLIKHDDI